MPTKALRVAVRCRTILPHDRDQRTCVRAVGDTSIEALDPEQLHPELRTKHGRQDYLKEGHNRHRAYTFDAVFGPEATNHTLYQALAAPLVPEVLAGKHATCFAYGQTGSGKTHTMLGRQGEAGLVELTLGCLFAQAAQCSATATVSFVEVYNETIRDLLQADCPILDLREDPLLGPCITGVTEAVATSVESVMALVRSGNAKRTEETTAANPVSSRSHAVLQLVVESVMPTRARKRVAKLSLIDLAGSERAANTGNKGVRLREGAMINRSLLALANCITALTRKGAYVNFRDSKLTRLLKDSLSGNCYTTMIAHVSPSILSFEETVNTLKYAHRACEIRGMSGGVRANMGGEVPVQMYADRMRACLEASQQLQQAVAKLAVPQRMASRKSARAHVRKASTATDLVDKLEKTRHKVVSKMRERVRIEQTALELDHQNQANEIELSKLELDVVLGQGGTGTADKTRIQNHQGPAETEAPSPGSVESHLRLLKMHGALRSAMKKNVAQRQKVEEQAAQAGRLAEHGKDEEELVSLLTEAKHIVQRAGNEETDDVEKRLLQMQHEMSLLEIEKIEVEQKNVVLESVARQREHALQKQQLQLELYKKALAVAETLLSKHGLHEEWQQGLGALVKILPMQQKVTAPSLDQLLAEISEPGTPVTAKRRSASATPSLAPTTTAEEASMISDDTELRQIDEGFQELRGTLRQSMRLTAPEDEGEGPEEEEEEEGLQLEPENGACDQPEEEEDGSLGRSPGASDDE